MTWIISLFAPGERGQARFRGEPGRMRDIAAGERAEPARPIGPPAGVAGRSPFYA
ncbi:hypothetical protein [Streptomyces sp. NPDC088554]|uniref:hypothetical protein n=1 Tax=Streptomyces sp. NPDC088554 TaxID=3365865 RepID=UPI00382FC46D